MGISIVPAGGDSFRLRQTITASGTVDLGQVRRAYIVLAGGGGSGGVPAGTAGGGGGGGCGGVVAGTMMAKWLGFQIGAGGAAATSNAAGGNDGNPSYMIIPANSRQGTPGNNTYNAVQVIIGCGGGKGFSSTVTQGTGNLSFANVGQPTFTNFSSNFNKVFGCSGAPGGGGSGGGTNTIAGQNYTIIANAQIGFMDGWEINLPIYYANDSTSASSNINIPAFIDSSTQKSWSLDTSSGITTYTGARSRWGTNTGSGSFVAAGDGQATGAGNDGNSGQFIGSGGAGGAGSSLGGAGGGGRWFLSGRSATVTSTGGSGGGGGAGIAGNGSDGANTGTAVGGAGGAGGLGGGGGGGAGANGTGTTARSSGKGGDGVALIFY